MSNATLIWLGVIVILAIVIVTLMASGRRRSGLRSLSPEAGARYRTEWRTIEAAFIEQPVEAVRRADRLAVSILQERGAEVVDSQRLPDSLQAARAAAAGHDDDTEGLRLAMLRYQRIVADAVGKEAEQAAPDGRREVAS